MEILAILASIIILLLTLGFLIGKFGSHNWVFGLNIKNKLKKKGFNVYNVNKSVWLDLGGEAFNTYNRLIHLIKGRNEVDDFYAHVALRDYNVNSETPNDTIKIRVIERYAEIINDYLVEKPEIKDIEFIIEIFEKNNNSIEDLLSK